MHILPFHRVLVTFASHFLNFPPQSSACNGSPQCTSFPCIEFLSRLQVIFINFPPPKLCMQWYSSMHILPLHRVLLTVASLFINFPPQSPTCNSSHQCIPSLSQSSCHDCKSFSNFPPKALHAMVFLNAHPSLSQSSCHDCKSFSKLPPPKARLAIVTRTL